MSTARIVVEAEATQTRPVWILPAAWYEPDVAERMAEHITRTKAQP